MMVIVSRYPQHDLWQPACDVLVDWNDMLCGVLANPDNPACCAIAYTKGKRVDKFRVS